MKYYILSLTLLLALVGCWGEGEPEIQSDEKQGNSSEKPQVTSPLETPDNLDAQASPNWDEEESASEKEALNRDKKEAEQSNIRSEEEEEAEYLLELEEQAERFSEQIKD